MLLILFWGTPAPPSHLKEAYLLCLSINADNEDKFRLKWVGEIKEDRARERERERESDREREERERERERETEQQKR
jgi:hypothetical protein